MGRKFYWLEMSPGKSLIAITLGAIVKGVICAMMAAT